MTATLRTEAAIEAIEAAAYRVPTERPESDGTLQWDATTIVIAQVRAAETLGIGYTYASAAAAELISSRLADAVLYRDALDVPGAWAAMRAAVRNDAPFGLSAYAIAAVDVALHDLKARLLDLPLASLLGRCRERVPVYGSGGFTSLPVPELQAQLAGWVAQGIPRVKMKVGRRPPDDQGRVRAARSAIGDDVELMVDANGAYAVPQALAAAEGFAEQGVSWLEEPVSSDDVAGLRAVRERRPAGMAIAAGEYATDAPGFRRLLEGGAVDVLQADVTRCGGISGLRIADALCQAHATPLSLHCAPAIHVHAGAALQAVADVEWFHDHARVEALAFDGAPAPDGGALAPDLTRPGLGLEVRHADLEAFRA